MRFYFPCAKGTQAIGHGEVFCGDSAAPALPKAFLIRNASMSWEHLLETHLVEEDGVDAGLDQQQLRLPRRDGPCELGVRPTPELGER